MIYSFSGLYLLYRKPKRNNCLVSFLCYSLAQWEWTGLCTSQLSLPLFSSPSLVWEHKEEWWAWDIYLLPLRGAQLERKAGKFCSQTTQSTSHQAAAVTSQQFFPWHLRHIFHSLRIDVLTLIKSRGGWQNYPHMAGAQMHKDVKRSGFNWTASFWDVVFYTQGHFALYGQ